MFAEHFLVDLYKPINLIGAAICYTINWLFIFIPFKIIWDQWGISTMYLRQLVMGKAFWYSLHFCSWRRSIALITEVCIYLSTSAGIYINARASYGVRLHVLELKTVTLLQGLILIYIIMNLIFYKVNSILQGHENVNLIDHLPTMCICCFRSSTGVGAVL